MAQGPKGSTSSFVIPVAETLDLKKAAKAAGVKSVSMLPQKKLLPPHRLRPRGLLPGGDGQGLPHLFCRGSHPGGHHGVLRREGGLPGGGGPLMTSSPW